MAVKKTTAQQTNTTHKTAVKKSTVKKPAAAKTAAKIANIRTNFPPFFKSAILAAAPLAAKNIQ